MKSSSRELPPVIRRRALAALSDLTQKASFFVPARAYLSQPGGTGLGGVGGGKKIKCGAVHAEPRSGRKEVSDSKMSQGRAGLVAFVQF